MSRTAVSSLSILLIAAVTTACSSSSSSAPGPDGGATADGGGGAGDSGGGDGASPEAAPSAGKTKSGESCALADLPPAGGCGTIDGTYAVTENVCSSPDPSCMNVQTATPITWTASVTVSGTTVKLTDGTRNLVRCALTPPCTCTHASGDEIHFTSTGFVGLGGSSCGGMISQKVLIKGVKQ